jgi:hypothetical protein
MNKNVHKQNFAKCGQCATTIAASIGPGDGLWGRAAFSAATCFRIFTGPYNLYAQNMFGLYSDYFPYILYIILINTYKNH